MSTTATEKRRTPPGKGEKFADWADSRIGLYPISKTNVRKIFPDHWSFMLGEICMYTFLIVLLTGVYLTLFFKPSMAEVVYNGPYAPMNGVHMTEAYASTLDISFEVRGGLLIRQIHHWSALIFIAAMAAHMMRTFFTGAFRKPREVNWLFGFTLLVLGCVAGFTGYSLPDDLLSGTGVRFMEGATLGVPLVGTYLAFFLWGGEFPGADIIPRFFAIHVLLVPGIMLGLFVGHLILLIYHKHTQFAGAGKGNHNVVGAPFMPVYLAKAGGFFFLVFGVVALIAGMFTINPVWDIGPYRPDQVSTGAQPDWYMGWTEGMIRFMPAWEFVIPGGYTVNMGVFIPLLLIGVVPTAIAVYPFFEAWLTKDTRDHNVADRPRNAPTRTAFGVAWLSWVFVLLIGGGNDLWATHFHLSINAITWFVRIAFFVLPPVMFVITRRICLGLQRADREKVLHGRETGIIKRLPQGEFIEVHERLPQAELHRLTAYDQYKPIELGPTVDENGVVRKQSRVEKLRVRLSKGYFGDEAQIPKPTAEEYREITSGNGHH